MKANLRGPLLRSEEGVKKKVPVLLESGMSKKRV